VCVCVCVYITLERIGAHYNINVQKRITDLT